MKKAFLILFGIGFGIVLGGLIFLIFNSFMQTTTVVVPDVTNLTGEEACKKLQEVGLRCSNVRKEDKVVKTFPEAGTVVKKGRVVELYYGKKDTVPNLNRVEVGMAEEILKRTGVRYRIIYFPYGEEKGKVLAVYPPAGSVIDETKEVFLLVDSGEKEEYFLVEDFVGKRVDEVAGRPGIVITGEGERIVSQYPPPGSIAREVVLVAGE